MEDAKIAAAQKHAKPDDLADLLETQFTEEAKEMNTGGKKKSKGKK